MNKSRSFFYFLLIAVCILSVYVFRDFISVALLALIVGYMLQPVYSYFYKKREWGSGLSTVLTFSFLLLVIIVPLLIVFQLTMVQLTQINEDLKSFQLPQDVTLDTTIARINSVFETVPFLEYELTPDTLSATIQGGISSIADTFARNALSISNASIRIVTELIFFIVFVLTFIPNYAKITKYISKLSPLSNDIDRLYLTRIAGMSSAMVKGSVVVALTQSILTGFLLWLFGVPYVFFLSLLTFVLCVMPFGSGVVLIPTGIIFLALGDIAKGLALILIYFFVISNIDNFLRPMLASKDSSVHPVLLMVGVVAGISVFGFWGFIYGPLVAIILITTLEVYLKEFAN